MLIELNIEGQLDIFLSFFTVSTIDSKKKKKVKKIFY